MRKGIVDIPFMFVFRSFLGAPGVCWATPFAEVVSVEIALMLYRRLCGLPDLQVCQRKQIIQTIFDGKFYLALV